MKAGVFDETFGAYGAEPHPHALPPSDLWSPSLSSERDRAYVIQMEHQSCDDPLREALPSVHEGVRKSLLLRALKDKLADAVAPVVPLLTAFAGLRDEVSEQIGDTRILFPEFTPHDEANHVVRLFQLADKMFGEDTYHKMNAGELFLLACALYAHDWGMAVGQDEREFLRLGGRQPWSGEVFAPLPDEADRLAHFACREAIKSPVTGGWTPLELPHLRQYVRETHARRSGSRVRRHFQAYPGLGQALAHVCEGHWHDFAVLDDPQRFPHDYDVAGHRTNLLALALQVRIVDLFHITDERTPYSLWRFVSPKDDQSAREWSKHRALHSVSVRPFAPGRSIRVQGFTEDATVWASLEDLRRYCDEQLHGTLNLVGRHNLVRYGLDFLKLDWAVTTGEFQPVSCRFNFDRSAMFRILSDDIYNGNRLVFLRELLQNAIDAVRVRRARYLQRTSADPRRRKALPFDTTIYFTARHKENGDVDILCRDYGVGMDEHVLRNYFAVAGVSYYRSHEFEGQHLGFRPISEFGVGILSCFMVCDQLVVRTYRDPNCGPPIASSDMQLPGAKEHEARRLQVTIPGVEREFIVTTMRGDFDVGTEVFVPVVARKVRQPCDSQDESAVPDDKKDFRRCLEITEYLCRIAGFVEFPILVEEQWPSLSEPKRTLILHPDSERSKATEGFSGVVKIHQLSRSYPWELMAAPESMAAVAEHLTEFSVDLRSGEDPVYDGWVTFAVPKSEEADLYEPKINWRSTVLQYRRREDPGVEILWKEKFPPVSLYRDGILVATVGILEDRKPRRRSEGPEVPNLLSPDGCGWLPGPCVHVNLRSAQSKSLNIARDSVRGGLESVWKDLLNSVTDEVARCYIAPSQNLSSPERLRKLGWLYAALGIRPDAMLRAGLSGCLPLPFFVAPGRMEVRDGPLAVGSEVPLLPDGILSAVRGVLATGTRDWDWRGPDSLMAHTFRDHHDYGQRWSRTVPALSISRALSLIASWSMGALTPTRVEFLGSPDIFMEGAGKA